MFTDLSLRPGHRIEKGGPLGSHTEECKFFVFPSRRSTLRQGFDSTLLHSYLFRDVSFTSFLIWGTWKNRRHTFEPKRLLTERYQFSLGSTLYEQVWHDPRILCCLKEFTVFVSFIFGSFVLFYFVLVVLTLTFDSTTRPSLCDFRTQLWIYFRPSPRFGPVWLLFPRLGPEDVLRPYWLPSFTPEFNVYQTSF